MDKMLSSLTGKHLQIISLYSELMNREIFGQTILDFQEDKLPNLIVGTQG
jgi:hypothetical protein